MKNQPAWDVAIWGTWPPPFGGMAIHIVRLMARLEAAGIRARVFNRASDAQDPPRAVAIGRHQMRWFLRFALFAPDKVLYVFTGRPLVRFLAWTLKVFRGKPYILRVGEEQLLQTLASGSWPARWMTRVALRGARHVVAVSPHLAEAVLSVGVPKERVHVIPGFIPPEDPSQEPAEEVVHFARAHNPVLAANGQLWIDPGDDGYGMSLLLEVLADLKRTYPSVGLTLSLYSTELALADLAAFRGRIDSMGLADNIQIRTEPHLFWPVLKYADLFLRPTRSEGDSASIREAIHLGVPVVASDAAPRPRPSVLFADGKAQDFQAKVRMVLADLPAWREEFLHAEVHDNAAAIIGLLRDCLRGDAPPLPPESKGPA